MLATSLPGYIPGGTVSTAPTSDCSASASKFGVRAACIGVCPSSSDIGRSAMPSGTSMMYFIFVLHLSASQYHWNMNNIQWL